MNMLWIWLVLFYGVMKGLREIVKKKALEKNSTVEVLFIYVSCIFICRSRCEKCDGAGGTVLFLYRGQIFCDLFGMDFQF